MLNPLGVSDSSELLHCLLQTEDTAPREPSSPLPTTSLNHYVRGRAWLTCGMVQASEARAASSAPWTRRPPHLCWGRRLGLEALGNAGTPEQSPAPTPTACSHRTRTPWHAGGHNLLQAQLLISTRRVAKGISSRADPMHNNGLALTISDPRQSTGRPVAGTKGLTCGHLRVQGLTCCGGATNVPLPCAPASAASVQSRAYSRATFPPTECPITTAAPPPWP